MGKKSRNATAVTFALVALVGAAGCHSSSGSPSANDNPVLSASGPTSSAPAGSPSSSASAPAPVSSASTSASVAATAGATTAASSAPAGRGTASGRPDGFTRAGVYHYDLRGTMTQPLSGTKSFSGAQTFTVDPPKGSSQHSRQADRQGTTDQTVAVRSAGIYLQDIRIANQGFDEDFRPVGDALFFPASHHTGARWSWKARSTDGKYTLDVSTKDSGASASTVGGSSQPATLVDSTLRITGNGFDLTVQQRDWVSTSYALILKEHAVTNGTAYGAHLSSDVTRTLRSTKPS